MEVWGGATFDVPTRFLNEEPVGASAHTETGRFRIPRSRCSCGVRTLSAIASIRMMWCAHS